MKIIALFLCFYFTLFTLSAQKPQVEYKNGKYGIIDPTTKKWLTAPTFRDISTIIFADGTLYFKARNDGKEHLIEADGKKINSPDYTYIYNIQRQQNFLKVENNKLQGLYDPKAKKLILPIIYTEITAVKPSFDLPATCFVVKTKNSASFFDPITQKLSIDAFERIETIDEAKALFAVYKNKKYNLYTYPQGVNKSDQAFDSYISYNSDGCLMLNSQEKYSLYTISNGKSTPYIYDFGLFKHEDQFMMRKNGKAGLLDSNFQTVIPFEYEYMDNFGKKILVIKDKKWGAFTYKGKPAIPIIYDSLGFRTISYLNDEARFIASKKNGKWGAVDFNNQVRIEHKYDTVVRAFSMGSFCFLNKGKNGVIDSTGTEIIPFSYQAIQEATAYLTGEGERNAYVIYNPCATCPPSEKPAGYGIADRQGKMILETSGNFIPLLNAKYSTISQPASNATVAEKKRYKEQIDSANIGFIWNIGGTKTATLMGRDDSSLIDMVDPTTGNVIQVMEPGSSHYSETIKGGKTGVVSPEGKIIIPIEYEDFSFSLRHRWKEIDDQIESINEPSLYQPEVYSLSDIQNYFAKKNGKWGYYAWPNKQIIEPIYDSLHFFNSNYDMSDSMYTALGYYKRVIVAYKEKIFYYLSNTGEILYKHTPGDRFYAEVSFKKKMNPEIYPEFDSYYIIVSNSQPKAFTSSRTEDVDEIDAEGNSITFKRTYTEQIITSVGGTIKFLHRGTFKFLFQEPVTDFELVSDDFYGDVNRQPRQVKWSDLSQRMRCFFGTSEFREISLDSLTNIDRYQPDLGMYQSPFIVTRNEKNALADAQGRTLFPGNFTHFQKLSTVLEGANNNLYLINNGCTKCDVYDGDGKWGLADSTGKIIIEPTANIIPLKNYEFINYSQALPGATLEQQERYTAAADSVNIGFMWNVGGTKTKTVMGVDSIMAEDFDPEGNLYSRTYLNYIYSNNFEGGKTGIVSKEGKIIIPVEYEDLGLTVFGRKLCGGEGCFVNIKSLTERSRALDQTYWFRGSKNYFGKKNGKWGYYTPQGKELIPAVYDSINRMNIDYPWLADYGDSLVKALGYHKDILQAFENKNIYYYTVNGKLLYKQLANESVSACVTFSSQMQGQPVKAGDNNQYFIVSINARNKKYTSERQFEGEDIDMWGNAVNVIKTIKDESITPVGGSYNFLHSGTFKFLFEEPIEDFYTLPKAHLADDYSGSSSYQKLHWNDLNNRLRALFKTTEFSEMRAGSTSIDYGYALSDYGKFPNKLFYKQKGKWYFRSLNEPESNNAGNGFDSIKVRSSDFYTAYVNGKSGVFNHDFKGPFNCDVEYSFPDYPGQYNIVCKDSKANYKTVYHAYEHLDIDPNTGNEIAFMATDTLKLLFVEKGKFNITDTAERFVLDKWYDDIVLPVYDDVSPFSITDSSSFIYHPDRYTNTNYPEFIKRCNHSLAVKDGNTWKLIDIKSPGKSVDGFENIQASGSSWIAIKNGKKWKYDVRNIWGEPEAITE